MKGQNTRFIPEKLVQLRIISHMTQVQLSKELNISRSSIANYETGKKNPSEDIAKHIANYFKIDVNYFYTQRGAHLSSEFHHKKSRDNIAYIAATDSLDMKDMSPLSRLALMEFYNFLQEQEKSAETED